MSVERICDQPKFKEELERIAAEQKRPLDDVLKLKTAYQNYMQIRTIF